MDLVAQGRTWVGIRTPKLEHILHQKDMLVLEVLEVLEVLVALVVPYSRHLLSVLVVLLAPGNLDNQGDREDRSLLLVQDSLEIQDNP